ncbi:hypothetical protein [Kitasatospora sp. NBC_00315]|uniref:hypothetical protein n=1 Tax=Kitasatospora sp. NBC_00315 TaxID=2975963 RepID=UPI00324A5390
MITDLEDMSVAEELRTRAGAFVNHHVDLWVAVEDDGTLILAGADPAVLFRAAADWLADGPAYTVAEVHWERQASEPALALRLRLERPGAAPALAPGPAAGGTI